VSALYTDNDAPSCRWLRALVEAGELPRGRVLEVDVRRLRPGDVGRGHAHFFAGIGGWPLAARLAGWPPALPLWTASLPCQPFSNAGSRKGTDDDRHLWPAFRVLADECRPPVLAGEQVASPPGRAWLASVRADLEAMGYAVGAADLCAASVGAPHNRPRLFWVAIADGFRSSVGAEGGLHGDGEPGPHHSRRGLDGDAGQRALRRAEGGHTPEHPGGHGPWERVEWRACEDGVRRPLEPGVEPVAHGVSRELVPDWKARVKGYGNAIVSQVAAAFLGSILDILREER